MDTRQKVAVYARVSSQEQAVEGVSIEAQIAALRAYAKSQGWELVDEYIDSGYSGGTDERPAFKRLLFDAGQHWFSIIAVCKLDRFFRNLRLLLNHLHGLEQMGIKFVSTQEGLDTSTPYGKFAMQIMGVIAEFERGRIGERVKDSRHYLISRGNWPGGRTLYGYRWLQEQREWEVIPEEAMVVRRVYDLYIRENRGIDAIVSRLNDEGVPSREGTRWRRAAVRKILIHPAYKGRHPLGITMPAIIDEATWQRAQEKRESARSVLREPKGWLLQGMCFCGLCGHALSCQRKRRDQHRYYACRGRLHYRSYEASKCTLPFIRADELEWGVWEKVKAVVKDQDALAESVNKALAELEARKSQVGVETLFINDRLEEIRGKMERLGMAFADCVVSESAYRSKLAQLKMQEAALLKRRHDIDPAQLSDLAALEDRIAGIKNILGNGKFIVSELGIFAMTDQEYAPVGFNAFTESEGKLAIGEAAVMDYYEFEGVDGVFRGITAPNGFFKCEDEREFNEVIIRNIRAIIQLFNLKVFVYPERAEIRGTIPPQILELSDDKQITIAPIILSPSPSKERGI